MPDDISSDALGQLGMARNAFAFESSKPFWYHLLSEVWNCDWTPFAAHLEAAGWNIAMTRAALEQQVRWQDAQISMHAVFRAGGIPVGSLWHKLPAVAANRWDGALQDAANAIHRTLVLIVPWTAGIDSVCDVAASRLLHFARHSNPDIGRRHWMHLRADDILDQGGPRWLFGLVPSRGAAADRREMFDESRRHGMLVLSGITPENADRVHTVVDGQRLRSVIAVSQSDWERASGQIWQGGRDAFAELPPMESEDLPHFFREWELQRHSQVNDEALARLSVAVGRRDVRVRLQKAFEIWKDARHHANGASPSVEDVDWAICQQERKGN